MLTLTERTARHKSVYNTTRAVSKAADTLFEKQRALHQYAWNYKMPALIQAGARAAEERYWEQYLALSRLSREISAVNDAIDARPFKWVSPDGESVTIFAGRLPNGEETSTNEAQALKMFAAYKARKAFSRRETVEVPF